MDNHIPDLESDYFNSEASLKLNSEINPLEAYTSDTRALEAFRNKKSSGKLLPQNFSNTKNIYEEFSNGKRKQGVLNYTTGKQMNPLQNSSLNTSSKKILSGSRKLIPRVGIEVSEELNMSQSSTGYNEHYFAQEQPTSHTSRPRGVSWLNNTHAKFPIEQIVEEGRPHSSSMINISPKDKSFKMLSSKPVLTPEFEKKQNLDMDDFRKQIKEKKKQLIRKNHKKSRNASKTSKKARNTSTTSKNMRKRSKIEITIGRKTTLGKKSISSSMIMEKSKSSSMKRLYNHSSKKKKKTVDKPGVMVYNSKFRQFCHEINKFRDITSVLQKKISPIEIKGFKRKTPRGFNQSMLSSRSVLGNFGKAVSMQSSVWRADSFGKSSFRGKQKK